MDNIQTIPASPAHHTGRYSSLRRMIARRLVDWWGGGDADAIWEHRDHEPGAISWEAHLTRRLRPWRWWLSIGTLMLASLGIWTIWWWLPVCLSAWPLLAGFLAGVIIHGLFILVVHDAAHSCLCGRRADRWLGALTCGALLLPFVAPDYVATHRRHHARANEDGDNNWTPLRAALFRRSRLLYMIFELIPLINNIDRLAPDRPRNQADHAAGLLAWMTALAVVWLATPTWSFIAMAYVGVAATNACRLWVEHMGYPHHAQNVSNTYGGCPLGFGIGNHALHHRHPTIPAPILTIGLWLRRHDAHVLIGWWRLLSDPQWKHFSEHRAAKMATEA